MEDEWDDYQKGGLRIRSRLEQEAGECLECTMIERDGRWTHEAECPYFEEDEADDDFFEDEEEEPGDFEDVENIDELLSHDVEAERLIAEEEKVKIPDEDLVDTFKEEEPEEIVAYDGEFDEDGNPVDE